MTSLAGRVVAVTGATGLIGRYLERELVARGARALAVVRNPQRAPAAWREKALAHGIDLREADLADTERLARAFEGADAVLANAGLISIGNESRDALVRANVIGTRNTFAALAQAGVRRAVTTSSTTVYRRKARGAYREDDPLRDARDLTTPFGYYATSKAAAEREAWEASRRFGIALSVARPSGVYGAFDAHGVTAWFARVMRPRLFTVFPTRLHVPCVYAGDLARAMVTMLEREVSVGRVYNLAGEPEIGFTELLAGYREAGGHAPRVVLPVPVPLRYAFDTRRAKDDLGFQNRPPREGFAELLALEREG